MSSFQKMLASDSHGPYPQEQLRPSSAAVRGFWLASSIITHSVFVGVVYVCLLDLDYGEAIPSLVSFFALFPLMVYLVLYCFVRPGDSSVGSVTFVVGCMLHAAIYTSLDLEHWQLWQCVAYSVWGLSVLCVAKFIDQHDDHLHLMKMTGMCFGQALVRRLMDWESPDMAAVVIMFAAISFPGVYQFIFGKNEKVLG